MSNKTTKELDYLHGIVLESDEYLKRKKKDIDEFCVEKVENGLQKIRLPTIREVVFSKVFSDYPLFQELGLDHSVVVSLVNEYLNDPEKIEYIGKD